MNRRSFLLGSCAAAATMAIPGNAVLVGDELYPALQTVGIGSPEEFYCIVHPRIYAILNDGLMYWSGVDLDGWEPVDAPVITFDEGEPDGLRVKRSERPGIFSLTEPFDKSPDTGVTTLPNV